MGAVRINPEYQPKGSYASANHMHSGYVTASDTQWQDLGNGIFYRVKNGFASVRGNSGSGGKSAATSGTLMATLPAAARPTLEIIGAATSKANNDAQFNIAVDGKVTVFCFGSASTYWAFIATYPVYA